MVRFIFLFLFLFYNSYAFAQDYWVYVRLEDRPGVTKEDDTGRSKRGDIVAILPATDQYTPSEVEKKEYLIIKTDNLTNNTILQALESDKTVAYRLRKLDIDTLGIPIKEGQNNSKISGQTITSKIEVKTAEDFNRYDSVRLVYNLKRPFMVALNWYEKKAYAETISTINKTGEDYNSCTLWEDAKDGDLVTDTRQETGALYDDDGELTDQCTIDGSTTNATYFMKFTAPSGERHPGTDTSGAKIKVTADFNDHTIDLNDDYTVVEWIRIFQSGFSNSTVARIQSSNSTFRYNILTATSTGGSKHGVGGSSSAVTNYIYRNFVYGSALSSGIQAGGFNAHTVIIYNNTVINVTGVGIDSVANGAADIIKNNLSLGNTTGYQYRDSTVFSNNGASDTTGEIDNLVADDEITNDTAGSEDPHLITGATSIDAGTNLGSPYDTDIDNTTVSGTWDIGADEVASATARRIIIIN